MSNKYFSGGGGGGITYKSLTSPLVITSGVTISSASYCFSDFDVHGFNTVIRDKKNDEDEMEVLKKYLLS